MKTYGENRAILRALGVKPASYASCEDVVERETRGMTFTRRICSVVAIPRGDEIRGLVQEAGRSTFGEFVERGESAAPSEEENETFPWRLRVRRK